MHSRRCVDRGCLHFAQTVDDILEMYSFLTFGSIERAKVCLTN